MKFTKAIVFPLLLSLSFLWKESDAIYISGMLRLFRGEGDYTDLSGNGYNLSTQGSGQSFVTATPYGVQSRQVMRFANAGRALGSPDGLPAGSAHRTIIGWFNYNGGPQGNGPFGYGAPGSNNAYYVYIPGGPANPTLNLDQGGQDEGINPLLQPVSANTWYHVAFSWDGTNNRGYLNGNLQATGTPDSAPGTVTTWVVIGGNPDGASNSYFNGDVADFAIFDRALTDAEVLAIYNAPEGLTAQGLLGAACTASNECVSGYCAGTSSPVCTDGAIGSVCDAGENADCASGFCGDGTCTSGAIGDSCSASTSCTTTYCDSSTNQCAAAPASGGGDPHYTLHFNEFITVQPLCDIVLMSAPDAYDGLGVTVHSRHATPKASRKDKSSNDLFYTYISNIGVEIGGVVFELAADGAKLFKNGSLFNIEEGMTYAQAGLPYTVKRRMKGLRKNQVEVEIDFPIDGSKIILRGNRHFKMAFLEVSGFAHIDVKGFLGRTDTHGFFHRNGTLLAESGDDVDLELYTNAWQVQEEDTKLFMEKEVFPQAPHKCIFVDSGDGIESNDVLNEIGIDNLLRGSRHRRRLLGGEGDSKLHAAAVEACAHHSDDSSPKKAWCIDDIMSSGNLELAEDTFYA